MAGVLYEVLGDTRFVPQQVCPDTLLGRQVTLQPVDGGEPISLEAEAACLATQVKAHLLEKGPDAEVAVPVRRATLSKVVNYMQYHKATPPQDICIPLTSENLADSGAGKWDVGFINVDMSLLFDLIYASSAMGLPTLNLLAKAKAATLMFGKSADQIRKDFNFINDLPKAEEAEILQLVGALRRKRGLPWEEEQGVAAGAAFMGGVWGLADAQGAKVPRQADERSWRLSTWRAAIAEDWKQLARAPAEVRGDRGLVLAALAVSQGQALRHASEELCADREVVLAAVAAGGRSLGEAAAELREDRSFVIEAIRLDGSALTGAGEALRSDAALVMKAAEVGSGSAMQGAAETLRTDAALALRCACLDPQTLLHIAESLREDRSFALEAVAVVPGALQFLPEKLRADREVVEAALALDPESLAAVHASRREEPLGESAAHAAKVRLVLASHKGPHQLGEVPGERVSWQTHKLQKSVVFSALSTFMPNMGQSNYIAANAFLDKVPAMTRPEIDSQCMMWGTIGGIGMRLKAFGSADFMNQRPDLLMTAKEATYILNAICTKWGTPEWMGAQYIEEQARNQMLSASVSRPEGYRPSEDALSYPRIPPGQRKASQRLGGVREGAQSGSRRQGEAPPATPERSRREAERGPLGGWPTLAGAEPAPGAAAKEPVEGDLVQLVGLKSKSGLTGKVVKCYAEGRCRVALDGNKGSALLRPEYLQVLLAVACY